MKNWFKKGFCCLFTVLMVQFAAGCASSSGQASSGGTLSGSQDEYVSGISEGGQNSGSSVSGKTDKTESRPTSTANPVPSQSVDISRLGGGHIAGKGSNNPNKHKNSAMSLFPDSGNLQTNAVSPVQKSVTYDSALRNTSDIKRGYILDDPFMCWPQYDGLLMNGWDIDNAAGGVYSSVYSYFKLVDRSTSEISAISRRFVLQSTGKVVTEMIIGIDDKSMAGSVFQLKSGTKVTVELAFTQDSISVALDGGAPKTVAFQTPGYIYGVRLEADFDAKTISVYVDGALCLENAPFKGSFDNVRIATSKSGKGALCLNYLVMYKGYSINEKFITGLAGYLPDDWRSAVGKNTAASVEKLNSQTAPDIFSLRLIDYNKTEEVKIYHPFAKITDKAYIEFTFMAEEGKDNLVCRVLDRKKTLCIIRVKDGKIYYIDAKGKTTKIYDYVYGMFFVVTVKASPKADTATVLVNQKVRAESVKMNAATSGIDGISFNTGVKDEAELWLDDINVYPILPLPSDYVPKPVPVDTGDFIVGVQSCSLWRSSYHLGWDRVNGYADRTPLLGWYEDGNPEVSDWETKYMVEHGISYQMYAFSRPAGNEGKPIKTPLHSAALLEGYFKSQYSDKIKFAIDFTNGPGNVKGQADFRNNLVPYLIEYFFKDPRYLVVDNKPVFAIYNFEALKNDLGGMLELKIELEHLRAQCRKIGFDGAYILASNEQQSASVISDIMACGFDYIYAYGWGFVYAGSGSGQISIMEDMVSHYGAYKLIATISHGMDPKEWMGTNAGGRITPAELKQICNYVKNQYVKRFSKDFLNSKMVLLGNWNEVAEGHFFTPAGPDPFAYLDVIRETFKKNPSAKHTDVIPTKAQKNRINILYPSDRVITRKTVSVPDVGACVNVIARWDFSLGTEGFAGEQWTGAVTASGGYLNILNPEQNSSRLVSPKFSYNTSDIKYIKIRLKGDTSDFNGKLYYKTGDMTDWDWVYGSRYMKLYKKGSGYTDYIVDVCNGSKWTGKFNGFMIWMFSMGKGYQIDFIELLGQ